MKGLTWPQARELARSGTPVRRAAWTTEWLMYALSLWWINRGEAGERVVQAEDFGKAEFFANDWTDELPADVDPCAQPPYSLNFIPPGIALKGEITNELTLTAALGDGTPDGIYALSFFVNGQLVGLLEAPTPGEYSITSALPSGALYAQVIASSVLPLPAWQGSDSWVPDETYLVVNAYGTGGTFYTGTMERFRILADGFEIWSLDGVSAPNWVGDTAANEPYSIAPAIVKIPKGTALVEMWLQENSNGYPVGPQALTPPFPSVTSGSSWYYKVVFSGKTVTVFEDSHTVSGFKYSPPYGDAYWTATGTTGVDTKVISKSMI